MNVSSRIDKPGAPAITAGALAAFGVLLVGLMTIGFAGMLGMEDFQGLYLIVIPAALLGVFLSWINERIWVYIAVLGHLAVFMTSMKEGVGGGEIAFSVMTLAGLCVWLFKETVIHRRILIRTGFDALLMGVFVSTSIVALIANRLHNGDLIGFVLEWTRMFAILLYFPLRKFIQSPSDVSKLIAMFVIVGIVTGIAGVATYRERLMKAVFAFEIEHSRIFTNEPVLMAYAILGTVIVAYARKRWVKAAGVMVTMSGLLFLAVTFSRGAIGSAIIGIVFVMMFSGRGKRVFAVLMFSLIVAATGVYMAFPNIATRLASSVGRRIGSIGAATTDVSFNLRVAEADALLDHYIPYSPFIGHGFGVHYHWYETEEHFTVNHTFIHNGYVKLPFKYGYPLAVFFLFFLAYPLLRLATRSPSKKDRRSHAMMVGSVAYLICALVNNYVSDMFNNFAGPLNFVLVWAILDYVNRTTAPAHQQAPLLEPPAEPLAAAGA